MITLVYLVYLKQVLAVSDFWQWPTCFVFQSYNKWAFGGVG